MTSESGSLSRFLALSAHDIKQPLNVLQMYLGILQRRHGSDGSDEINQVVGSSLQQLQASLNLLTQWGRAEQSCIKQIPEETSASDWLRQLKELKRVDLEATEKVHSTTVPCRFDSTLARQTLQDLITLLPEASRIELTAPWELTLHCSSLLEEKTEDGSQAGYRDALYQLAVDAGQSIFAALGACLKAHHRDEESILSLKING